MRPNRTLLLLTAATLLAAGCGDANDDTVAEPDTVDESETTDEPDTVDEAETTDEPEVAAEESGDPVTVTLLTHDSFDVSEDVLAAFTQDTGIEVEIVPLGDAGTALNQTILTADSPQGDLLFGVDTTFLSRALDEDIFTAYSSPLLAHVPDAYELDPEHRATPIDVGDVCLNYDVAWFEDNGLAVPSDLDDLTDPAYDGLLAVQNPATSSPGLAFLLATVERFGEDGWLDFWEALVANDVVVTDGWSEAYYDEFSATGGTRPLVVSYASSPPAEVFFADPQPDEAPTGVVDASCFRQIEFVGILAGTEHEAEAQALVDFMLDTTFQEDIPLTMFVFPVNEDAELPEVFVEHAALPDDAFELDPAVIGENREAWIESWTSTVLR